MAGSAQGVPPPLPVLSFAPSITRRGRWARTTSPAPEEGAAGRREARVRVRRGNAVSVDLMAIGAARQGLHFARPCSFRASDIRQRQARSPEGPYRPDIAPI